MTRKRYAIVGASNRAFCMFFKPILETFQHRAEMVALLDKDHSRMNWFNQETGTNFPTFLPDQFDEMVKTTRPDVVIVACFDGMHHHYIIQALKHNLEVVVEKPLTIDEEKCAAITKALANSKGKVTLTFNYRYSPPVTKIRELIAEGKIGRVVSVDLNWYLDTYHGSTYFQRWNRLREMSGGLSIHKACHHFDLVHWWINQKVTEVFAYGALNFYGPKGVHNPLKPEQIGDGRTCLTCDIRRECKYFMRWNRDEFRRDNHEEALPPGESTRKYEGYTTRQCIFDPQINIEDTYAAVMKYDGGAFLTYSLNASVPYEGFRVGINGTEGRIEFTDFHSMRGLPFRDSGPQPVCYIPMFGRRELIDATEATDGHGGGDPLILEELFLGPDLNAPVKRVAGLEDGIEAVLTGVAVHRSANEHRNISVEEMRKRVFAP
jgi:predicted dehydrogenase